MTAPRPLSAAGRAWAIDSALRIRPDIFTILGNTERFDDAVALAGDSSFCGYGDTESRWWCDGGAIHVQAADGTAGIVTWREVVQAARATATQMVLL